MNKNELVLPRGIELHGNSIRIVFQYDGKRCREVLSNITRVNKNAIAYAANKRAVIVAEIKEGRFDYVAHFPTSKAASKLALRTSSRTVSDGVDIFLEVMQAKKATSTFVNYRRKSKKLLEKWGDRRICDIQKSEIELFQVELMEQHNLSAKTVNDIFIIVRGVWADAFHDEVIGTNPLERIRNLDRGEVDTADPFTREEIERFKSSATRPHEHNMFLFDMWAGLSLSELAALAWEDIDTDEWTINVNRARVETEYKVPKERSRVRKIELVEPAIEYLKQQQALTQMLSPQEISIKQRNNITEKTERVRFVFFNDLNGDLQPWHASSMLRRFGDILKRAGIRHRGPNQCRHTFASQCLSHYVPMEWLARQLGHSDTSMIKKHYGRWIPTDSPSMAGLVSEMLGFDAASSGLKKGDIAPIMPHEKRDAMNYGG